MCIRDRVRLGCEDNWNEIGKRLAFEICKDELQVRGIGQKKSSKDGRIRVAQIARYGNHIRSLILWKCPDLKPISNAELANTIILTCHPDRDADETAIGFEKTPLANGYEELIYATREIFSPNKKRVPDKLAEEFSEGLKYHAFSGNTG